VRASAAPAVAPRDVTELRLARIWKQVLAVEQVGVTDSFFELGGHSLLAIRLLAAVEHEFGRKLPLASLFRAPTIEALARAVEDGAPHADELGAVVTIRDGAPDRPVFLIPGAGGNVLYFYDLARHLDTGSIIYGLQGLQAVHAGGEPRLDTLVSDIADRYLREIRAVQPAGPYHLIGHSFGGWVAFELAHRLVAAGESVALLGILDSPAPVALDSPTGRDWDSATWVLVLAGVVERLYGAPLGLAEAELRGLDKRGQIAVLAERMKQLGALPPGVDSARMEGFYEIFRADQLCVYNPAAPYPAQVTLFRAIESNPDNARGPEMLPILEDPQLGWTAFSTQPIEVFDVPGDHLTIMREPHVQVLAGAIRARLGAAACVPFAKHRG
jgi:thioesterase domain-containing protein/acyl carrier protein